MSLCQSLFAKAVLTGIVLTLCSNASADDPVTLIQQYCVDCHGAPDEAPEGDFSLTADFKLQSLLKTGPTLKKALDAIEGFEMPPADSDQPTSEQRIQMAAVIRKWLAKPTVGDRRDPGSPVLRHLTRLEYNNTIRDLLGLETDVFMFSERLPFDRGHYQPETGKVADQFTMGAREYGAKYPVLLNAMQLDEVERCIAKFESNDATTRVKSANGDKSAHSLNWPNAPVHRLEGKGTFIVTAGTYQKQHRFRDADRLDYLQSELLSKAKQYHWHIEAWAIFSNHYHFVGHALEDAKSLKPFLTHLHADTAREINRLDDVTERQVWFNFWDTELTYERSYLARLNYVHHNPVKHGIVPVANQYHWGSAAWFERTASPAQVKTIYSFKTDKVNVIDDFEVFGVR